MILVNQIHVQAIDEQISGENWNKIKFWNIEPQLIFLDINYNQILNVPFMNIYLANSKQANKKIQWN